MNVVISPMQKNQLADWNKSLTEYEERLSNSQTEVEREINQTMCEFILNRILTLENSLYAGA